MFVSCLDFQAPRAREAVACSALFLVAFVSATASGVITEAPEFRGQRTANPICRHLLRAFRMANRTYMESGHPTSPRCHSVNG